MRDQDADNKKAEEGADPAAPSSHLHTDLRQIEYEPLTGDRHADESEEQMSGFHRPHPYEMNQQVQQAAGDWNHKEEKEKGEDGSPKGSEAVN